MTPNWQTWPSEVRILVKRAVVALKRLRKTLHPKQQTAFESSATEILYGGAAGGGKSHLFRVVAIIWAKLIPGLQIYFFRREFPDLWKNHMEGPTSFPVLLAPLVEAGICKINYSDHFIKFRNGSTIHLCHCQHEKDMWGYQGAEMHVLIVEEVTQFTAKIFRYLRSRVRLGAMASKIPAKWAHLFPRVYAGGNPGGVGHNWVKAAWVDFAPPMEIKKADGDGGFLRQYIPARLEDNPTLLADAGYEDRLTAIGDPALVKAMRDGNWDIVAGGMFDDVWGGAISPFDIPSSWRIDRSFDWGSSKPFSVGFWAESDGTEATMPDGTKKSWPRGTLFRIAEIYGWNGQPNEGCRKLAVEVARDIVAFQKEVPWGHRVLPGPADNSIFDAENGVCIADDMAKLGVRWERSDKSPGSRKTGWEAMRRMFKACQTSPMEDPGLFAFDTCRQFIRTVPTLPRDANQTDDVDTHAEDHCLAGGTIVETSNGPIPIKDLVGTEGLVYSSDGRLHPYTNCRLTRKNAPVIRVTFGNEASIVCTPDHRVMVSDGRWIEAQDLADETGYCILVPRGPLWSPLSAPPFKNSLGCATTPAGSISSTRGSGYIVPCGNTPTMSPFQRGIPSITSTTIDPITSLKILRSSLLGNISRITRFVVRNFAERLSKRLKRLRLCGMGARKESDGTKLNMPNIATMPSQERKIEFAISARSHFRGCGAGNSVPTSAKPLGVESPGLTSKNESAQYAGRHSSSTNTGQTKHAVGHAGENCGVARIDPAPPEDVYCLDVPSLHAFAVEGGFIVHNCADEARYRCLAVRTISKIVPLPF